MIPILLLGLLALMILAQVYNIVSEFEFEKGKSNLFRENTIWKAKYLIIILMSFIVSAIINITNLKESVMIPIYIGVVIITIIRIIEKIDIYKDIKGLIVKSLIIISPLLKLILLITLTYSFNNIWHYWKDHDPEDIEYYQLSILLWGAFISLIIYPIWISKKITATNIV